MMDCEGKVMVAILSPAFGRAVHTQRRCGPGIFEKDTVDTTQRRTRAPPPAAVGCKRWS